MDREREQAKRASLNPITVGAALLVACLAVAGAVLGSMRGREGVSQAMQLNERNALLERIERLERANAALQQESDIATSQSGLRREVGVHDTPPPPAGPPGLAGHTPQPDKVSFDMFRLSGNRYVCMAWALLLFSTPVVVVHISQLLPASLPASPSLSPSLPPCVYTRAPCASRVRRSHQGRPGCNSKAKAPP